MAVTSISANIVCKRIKTTLNAAGSPWNFDSENHFGGIVRKFDEILQQVGKIYIFWESVDYEQISNETIHGQIWFQFLIVDQTLGASESKSDYTQDLFRDYLTRGSWKNLGIPTDYPDKEWGHFMLESERVFNDEDGKSIAIFRGWIDFWEGNLT